MSSKSFLGSFHQETMTKTIVIISIIIFSFIPIAFGFVDTLLKTPRQDRTQTSTQGGMFYLCENELSIKKLYYLP